MTPFDPSSRQENVTTVNVVTEFSTDDVIFALISAIGNHLDTDPNNLPPLYYTIDPEALVSILRLNSGDIPHTATSSMSFVYEGLHITLCNDGTAILVDDTSLSHSTGGSR